MPSQPTLAFVAPLLEDSYFGTLLAGIEHVVLQQGARLIAIQTSGPQATASAQELPLAWETIDGWIGTQDGLTPEYLQAIQRTRKPGVLISATLPELNCTSVRVDNQSGMAAAVQHLIEHGHTRIAFVGCLDQDDIRQRYAGYQAALIAHGITPDPELLFAAADQVEHGGRVAAQVLIGSGLPCTAVVAATDLNAVGLLAVVQDAGYRVPEDLAVIGFDDMPLSQFTTPPLASVHQSFAAISGRAAEALLQQLAGSPAPADVLYVPTSLVRRSSCGCANIADSTPEEAPLDAQDDWPAQLAHRLVQIAIQPEPLEKAPASVWPGVSAVVQALDAALSDAAAPEPAVLQEAWQAGFALARRNVQRFRTMFTCVHHAAQQRLAATGNADAATGRVAAVLDQLRMHQAYAEQQAATQQVLQLEQMLQNNYALNVALTGAQLDVARDLSWLAHTAVQRACLGLWSQPAGQPAQIEIVATYGDDQATLPALGQRYAAASFPPAELWPDTAARGASTLCLLPLRTADSSWGVLALFVPRENRISSGEGRLRQWTTLLSNALERKALLESLAAQRDSLSLAVEREQLLTETIRELGCPILPLSAEVLLIPLIGAIDGQRAQQFIEAMLQGITRHRATTVLLDITGVPLVDTHVANAFIQATQAAVLLGARVVLVGLRPEIAQSIVALGIDLRHMATAPSLAVAIQMFGRRSSVYA